MARQLSWGSIHRLWQMLLKGLQDVDVAPDPREAAEMALLRLIHAADHAGPGVPNCEAQWGRGCRGASKCACRQAARPYGAVARRLSCADQSLRTGRQAQSRGPAPRPGRIGALCSAGASAFGRRGPLRGDWPRDLAMQLKSLTGTSWQVSLSDEAASRRCSIRRKWPRNAFAPKSGGSQCPLGDGCVSRFRAGILFHERHLTCPRCPIFDEIPEKFGAECRRTSLQKAQDNLDKVEVEGSAGGGLVKIRATAEGRILAVDIDESFRPHPRKRWSRTWSRRRYQRRTSHGGRGGGRGNAEDETGRRRFRRDSSCRYCL